MLSDRCLYCPVCAVCDIGVLWPNGWMDQDATWYGSGPRHRPLVLDGDPAPLPQKVQSCLHFSAHVCCGQTAGWIKMPLGTEVGLGPGVIVLDGDPSSAPQKGGTARNYRPRSIVAKRLDGPKSGGLLSPFLGDLGLHLTQCDLGRGLPPF